MNNKINLIATVQRIMTAIITMIILLWASLKNGLMVQIFILPFLICTIAYLFENIFFLLKKDKLTNIAHKIFAISIFSYALGFLIYAIYDIIKNRNYSFIIIVLIDVMILSYMIKKTFFKKKTK